MDNAFKFKTMKLVVIFSLFSQLLTVSEGSESNIYIFNQRENEILKEQTDDLVTFPGKHTETGTKSFAQTKQHKPNLARREAIASKNLEHFNRQRETSNKQRKRQLKLGEFLPGQKVKPFTILTLKGQDKLTPLVYPGDVINYSNPVIIHGFNAASGFLGCLWNCSSSVEGLFLIRSYSNDTKFDTHFIFLSHSKDAFSDAVWMRNRIVEAGQKLVSAGKIPQSTLDHVLSTLHFGVEPLYALGNWIPGVLGEWACQDHNCGLDQVKITCNTSQQGVPRGISQGVPRGVPQVLPRLDARYDWLPSATSSFGNKTFDLSYVTDGCKNVTGVKGKIAFMFDNATCSHFDQVFNMNASGAAGVIFLSADHTRDLNCEGAECDTQLSIPASSVKYEPDSVWDEMLKNRLNYMIQFQNTPSDTFFLGIESGGLLSEVGWLLYPSFDFLGWQSQWYNYAVNLQDKLSQPVVVVPVLNKTTMQGARGAVGNISLPQDLHHYSRVELDLSLSCPGSRDETCPAWDHTVQLYVCCQPDSPLCGMELGRWITPFRRRIGRWLSDVSDLVSLMNSSSQCSFTIKTAPWAQPWVVSLQLRLSDRQKSAVAQQAVVPFRTGSITFNKQYNDQFKPYSFTVPASTKQVYIVWRITGHGSDEHGCGEFCVTSHHYVINGNWNNVTYDNPENPLGCTLPVGTHGAVPNEHGTWLYGRDGWCDGQDVPAHVTDVTNQVDFSGTNVLRYYGFFEGKDPDPQENPGIMIHYAYLVFLHG